MAFVPADKCAVVCIRGQNMGQQTENDLYFQFSAAPTAAQLLALAEAIGEVVAFTWVNNLPSSWSLREIYARSLHTEFAPQATDTTYAGTPGVAAGDPAPTYVTKAVARRSGLTGRSSRGRIFWQGLSEGQITANLLGTPHTTQIVGAIEAADAAAEALGWVPVILSYVQGGVPLEEAAIFTLVQWLMTDLFVDTRRSRKPGSGS